MSAHRPVSSVGLTCAALAITVSALTGCTTHDDRSDSPDTTFPEASVTGDDALAGVELPPAGSTGVVVQVPGELDALIAAHAAARDDLRACIDGHDDVSTGSGPQRFPC